MDSVGFENRLARTDDRYEGDNAADAHTIGGGCRTAEETEASYLVWSVHWLTTRAAPADHCQFIDSWGTAETVTLAIIADLDAGEYVLSGQSLRTSTAHRSRRQ